MLQPPENKNATPMASNPNTYAPVKASSAPMEQATIGRSLVINVPGSAKGATESLEAVLPMLGHAIQLLHGHTAHE